jgi:hypothetical protein
MTSKCPHCGETIDSNDRFCGGCGKSVEVEKPAEIPKPSRPFPTRPKKVAANSHDDSGATEDSSNKALKPALFLLVLLLVTGVVAGVLFFQGNQSTDADANNPASTSAVGNAVTNPQPGGVTPNGAVGKRKQGGICETTGQDNQFGPFRLCASSVLPPQGRNRYGVGRALDFNEKTAWVEGVKGNGEGEWLELDLGSESHFQTLNLVNGYAKSNRAFSSNGRVRALRVETADGLDLRLQLKDSMRQQSFRLPRKVVSPWLRLTILSVYPGSRWQDTAISEVWVDLEEFNYQDAPPPPATNLLDENSALDKVMAIEQVRRWADQVGKAGGGVLWQTDRRPQADCSGNSCLWCFRLQEQKATYNTTFGIYCIDARNLSLARIDPVTDRLEPVAASQPISADDLLRSIPGSMQGWLRWRDRDNTITMNIDWRSRGKKQGLAEFVGEVNYRSGPNGRVTKAELRMRIDPQTRNVTLDEREIAKQADFDTGGRFHGTLQVDRRSVVGEWRKAGYTRVADFSIY